MQKGGTFRVHGVELRVLHQAVIPAKAGIFLGRDLRMEIPVCAGMTWEGEDAGREGEGAKKPDRRPKPPARSPGSP